MDNIAYYYYTLIAIVVLYGLGMYFWGYPSGLNKAMDDLKEILEEEEQHGSTC